MRPERSREAAGTAGIPISRARLYRLAFAMAALYNIAFGLWAVCWPLSFFRLFRMPVPTYPAIWACLGMVIGLYGLGYAYAAVRLDRAAPFIAIGLAGKIIGPIGWTMSVLSGDWPPRTFTLVALNDLAWWIPFSVFLLEGTRVGFRIRAVAPYACAALNGVAALSMLVVLRPGTEVVAEPMARLGYISRHPILWRGGWGLWMVAAVSLLAFYAWWAAALHSTTQAVTAVAVAAIGVACDLFAESLLIGWLPADYDRVMPLGTLLTAGVANGLYTVAGVLLTLATPSLSGTVRVWTWVIWIAGGGMAAAAFVGSVAGIVVTTAVLFTLLCPWAVIMGRHLDRTA